MAVPRWPIVLGIVAIGGAGAYVVSRGGGSRPAAPVDPQGSAIVGSGRAAVAAPAGPALGSGSAAVEAAPVAAASGDAGVDAGAGPRVEFTAQTRDPRWAGATEVEIKRRLAALDGGALQAAECRQDQCELTIGGSSEAVAATLADLERARGLRGFARTVLLTAPEERDGKLVVRAYAVFDRAPATPPDSSSRGR